VCSDVNVLCDCQCVRVFMRERETLPRDCKRRHQAFALASVRTREATEATDL